MSKANVATYLRTDETWAKYQNEPKRCSDDCFMCSFDESDIQMVFRHWTIVRNQYPYDAVSHQHDMLIPVRHINKDSNLTAEELEELDGILTEIEERGEYDCIIKNFPVGQSHPSHLHYHLLTWKRR